VENDVATMNAILEEADDAEKFNYKTIEHAGVATGFAVARRIDTVTVGGRIIFMVLDDRLEVEHRDSPRGPDPPPSDWSALRLWEEEDRRWQGSVTSLRRS
jgi:hypothetical protein